MNYVTITNRTQKRLGVCGTTLPPRGTFQFPLVKLQDWSFKTYAAQLAALQQNGDILVTLDNQALGVTQTLDLNAPLPSEVFGLVASTTHIPIVGTADTRVDVWIKGVTGDDSNDGKSEDKAVKTVGRAAAIVNGVIGPDTKYVVVNFRETITLNYGADQAGFMFLTNTGRKTVDHTDCRIILSGSMGVTIVLDDGAGADIVSDINAAGQVGLSTATWTYNEFRSMWCKFSTGPLAGQRFMIRKNDGTKLYLLDVGPDVVPDPGAGAEFHIERPETEITSSPFSFIDLALQVSGPHEAFIQFLYITGGTGLDYDPRDGNSVCTFSHIVHSCDALVYPWVLGGNRSSTIAFGGAYMDTSTETPTPGDERVGYGQVNNSFAPAVNFASMEQFNLFWSVIPFFVSYYGSQCYFYGCSVEAYAEIDYGNSAHGGAAAAEHTAALGDVPGVPTRFGGYRETGVPGTPVYPGALIEHSSMSFNQSILDDGTFGFEAVGNSVVSVKTVTGSNAVAGAVGHSGAVIWQSPLGAASTLTGNGGTVEISKDVDGSTQVSTWAALAGTPVSDPELIAKNHHPSGPPWA